MAEYRLPTYTMDLPTFIDAKKHELAVDLKVSKLGTIEKYDEKTCTASVKLMTLFDEKTPYKWEYPVLPNVPVVRNKYISHPIKEGDGCLVIFLDSDFTAWLDKGEREAPITPRLHNLNDPIAIVGIDTVSKRPSFGNDNVEINADSGKIDFKNKNGNLTDILQGILTLLGDLNKSLDQIKSTYFPYVRAGMDTDLSSLKSAIESLVVGNYNIPT